MDDVVLKQMTTNHFPNESLQRALNLSNEDLARLQQRFARTDKSVVTDDSIATGESSAAETSSAAEKDFEITEEEIDDVDTNRFPYTYENAQWTGPAEKKSN
jgi:hypothetical protein